MLMAVWFAPPCDRARTTLCLDPSLAAVGQSEYAEALDPNSFLKMPWNAAVNIGYAVVGFVWLRRAAQLQRQQLFRAAAAHASGRELASASADAVDVQRYLLTLFATLSVAYGPVQFARILTQSWRLGVIDQWITPPFFAFAALSAGCAVAGLVDAPQPAAPLSSFLARLPLVQRLGPVVLYASAATYVAAVLWPAYGFDAVLGAHVLVSACTALLLSARFRPVRRQLLRPFALAFVCCAGFVGLKLADHALAREFPLLFGSLTGHFWSKICDFLQIHYTAHFLDVAMTFAAATPRPLTAAAAGAAHSEGADAKAKKSD